MSEHTPTPWAFEPAQPHSLLLPIECYIRVYAENPGRENDFTIALVRDADKETRENNARLISIAPIGKELTDAVLEAWNSDNWMGMSHKRHIIQLTEKLKANVEGRS